MNDLFQKKSHLGLLIFILLLALVGLLWAFGILTVPVGIKEILKNPQIIIEPDANLMTVRNAYDTALIRARQWQPDAKLADTKSLPDTTSPNGKSDNWDFLFVSDNAKKKGFKILIAGGVITNAEEIPYVGKGGELPEEIISAREAIDKVHAIRGYENEKVISVELLYDPKGFWYWGVQTSKGVVSVKADK